MSTLKLYPWTETSKAAMADLHLITVDLLQATLCAFRLV